MIRTAIAFVACLLFCFSSADSSFAGSDSDLSFHVFALPRSDELEIQLKLKNNSEKGKILSFSSSKKYEIVIKSKNGEEVYRYSAGKQFLQAIQKLEFKPSQTYTWKETWNYKNKDEKIIRGEYSIEAILFSSKKVGEEIVAKTNATFPLEDHPVFKKIRSSGGGGMYHLEGIARTANPVFYTIEDGHREIISNKKIVIDKDGSFEFDVTIPKDELPSNGSLILYLYDGNGSNNPLFVVLDVFL